MSDPVNHPAHYHSVYLHVGCGKAIECIDIVRHMNFNLGNVVKYIWRADHKGATIEDLKKARWYLDDEIKRLEAAAGTAITPENLTDEQALAAVKAAVQGAAVLGALDVPLGPSGSRYVADKYVADKMAENYSAGRGF
jgi:hypothetical protein